MNIKTEAVSLWGQPLLLMPQHKIGIFSKYNKISQLIYTQCIAN